MNKRTRAMDAPASPKVSDYIVISTSLYKLHACKSSVHFSDGRTCTD